MAFSPIELIRADMLVREVSKRHPETRPIFSRHNIRDIGQDCTVELFAHAAGLDPRELVDELNLAVDANLRIRLEQEG